MFCFLIGFTFLMRHVSTSRMRAPNATASQHLIYTTPSHASYRWASQHKGRQPFHFFAFIAFIALAFMAFIAFFLAGAAGAAAAFMAFIAFAMLAKEESCVEHNGAESKISRAKYKEYIYIYVYHNNAIQESPRIRYMRLLTNYISPEQLHQQMREDRRSDQLKNEGGYTRTLARGRQDRTSPGRSVPRGWPPRPRA